MPGFEMHQRSDEVKSVGASKGDDDVAERGVRRDQTS